MATGAELLIHISEKSFGDEQLFSDLRIEVPPNQVLALLGPSGVGKSTLLRLIAGIDRNYAGRITVGGHQPEDAGVPGFMFQDPRLLPWENAVGNLSAVCPDLTERRAHKLLATVGLAGAEMLRPAELSGGMQRRVALARALAVSPRLLLLDEPFTSLDRKLARELQHLLAEIIDREGPTVILVSHDPADAARLADRIITLEGRPAEIVQDFTPDKPRGHRTEAEIDAIAHEIDSSATGKA